MIKGKVIGKLALTLAAGCLSVGVLGVDASAQPPTPLVTVIIGDNLTFKDMDLGVAAKLLVSHVCGVDERDAKDILELAAINNQKIVAICPGTGAVFHVIPQQRLTSVKITEPSCTARIRYMTECRTLGHSIAQLREIVNCRNAGAECVRCWPALGKSNKLKWSG